VIGDGQYSRAVLARVGGHLFLVLLESVWVQLLCEHDLLKEDHGAHSVVESQLVLVELRENRANVQVSVCLDLGSLQARLNRESPLQEGKSKSHFADTSVVAGHVVESHSLSKLVVLTEFLGLSKEIESTVDIFLLEVVDSEDVANLAKLLATLGEFAARSAVVELLDFQKFLQNANCLNVLALLNQTWSVTENERRKKNTIPNVLFTSLWY
jgi:hypothetical protein